MDTKHPHPTDRRTLVMGILNVTDDSFSDGGLYRETVSAVRHGLDMLSHGADIIDIGGESTRPGATRVSAELEIRRVIPVISQLAEQYQMENPTAGSPQTMHQPVMSVDTMRAITAEAAIDAGAQIINDVSGGLADPAMLTLAAQTGVKICLMHWNTTVFHGAQGYHDHGDDITSHVIGWLRERVDAALSAGVKEENIILDPGIGFAKSPADNWELLKNTHRFVQLGFPVLIGASRKRFLTALRPGADGQPGSPESADDATAAVSALSAAAGAWAVRVHAIAPNRAAVDVATAYNNGDGPPVAASWRARRR